MRNILLLVIAFIGLVAIFNIIIELPINYDYDIKPKKNINTYEGNLNSSRSNVYLSDRKKAKAWVNNFKHQDKTNDDNIANLKLCKSNCSTNLKQCKSNCSANLNLFKSN